jgi:hypothetical protein
MARRGAPDKNELAAPSTVVMACPSCDSELRLEAEWLEGEADLLCGRCETEISLAPAKESGAG